MRSDGGINGRGLLFLEFGRGRGMFCELAGLAIAVARYVVPWLLYSSMFATVFVGFLVSEPANMLFSLSQSAIDRPELLSFRSSRAELQI